jgi:shikimate dehydrogenase
MRVGLLGYPIAHSLSPTIHNAAYRELGLDWHYDLYPCPDREAFERTLAKVRANPEAYVGLNVTTPYKSAAYEASAEPSPEATLIKSANVLTLSCDPMADTPHFKCDNTDGEGFVASLEQQAGIKSSGAEFVICGSGSVATSILLSLIKRQAARISLVSRDSQAAQKRIDALCLHPALAQAALPHLQVISYEEIAPHLDIAQVLIDATTVGMSPTDEAVIPLELLRPNLIVCDVVYGHGETALIKAARQCGAKAYDGLGMLVEQAGLSIELWAEQQGHPLKAPRQLMHKVARNELDNRCNTR